LLHIDDVTDALKLILARRRVAFSVYMVHVTGLTTASAVWRPGCCRCASKIDRRRRAPCIGCIRLLHTLSLDT